MSAAVSPPVAEVKAPQAAGEGLGEAFADAMSLELVQKESSLAGKPLKGTSPLNDVGSPRGFKDALGLEELPHRKQPLSPGMASAGSAASEAAPAVSAMSASSQSGKSRCCSTDLTAEGVEGSNNLGAKSSHRTHLDVSGPVASGAVAEATGKPLAKPGAGSNLLILPEPTDQEVLDRTGLPIGSTADVSEVARVSATSHSTPVAPIVAERTRSEAAFLEAMPLELPAKKKQPLAAKPVVTARTSSDITQPDEALPLEKTRTHSQSPSARRQQSVSSASSTSSQPGPSWEQAVPLEMTRRRGPSVQASILTRPPCL